MDRDYTFRPFIKNKKSKSILRRRQSKGTLEERLVNYGLESKKKTDFKREKLVYEDMGESGGFMPTINKNSRRIMEER